MSRVAAQGDVQRARSETILAMPHIEATGGCTHFMHTLSLKTIDPRIPTALKGRGRALMDEGAS